MSARPTFRLARSYAEQARDGQWLSVKNLIWVLVALAVGLFVRVNALAAQSLWNDEGTSVALAQTSFSAILNAAAHDIHPPLYYLLLSAWVQLAGISEFSVRFLSVIAGVLVIAVTFRIAREFFDQDVAVIAAVLSALNPFQVYYAQETRMYIWVTLFAALSVWAMVVMFKPPRERTPARSNRTRRSVFFFLYILFTLSALYTNYYAFTLVLVENLAFLAWLIWAWRAKRPHIGHSVAFWVIAQVVIALAYLPWILFARQSLTSWPGISEPMALWEMGTRIASAFVTGADSLRDFQALLVAAYVIFFIGGLLPSRDLFKQSAWGIVTCFLWAVVPFLAMFVVSLSRPAYNPKFLLLATPGFLILVARGVSVLYPGLFLRERAPAYSQTQGGGNTIARQLIGIGKLFVGVLFAAGTVLALQSMYSDPRLQRDDYRGIVGYINAVATAQDAVVVNAPGQMDVVRYYFHGPALLVGAPIGRPAHKDMTETLMDEVVTRPNIYGIFWATEQSDPESIVERRLADATFKASDEWHGDVRLVQYASPSPQDWQTTPANARFGDEILLEQYKFPVSESADEQVIPIELDWRPLKLPPAARYKVFAQLLDANGRLVSQRDSEPRDGFHPTDKWTTDDTVVDRIAIPIPPGLAPGKYTVIAGLYNADTGERLPVSRTGGGENSNYVTLGQLEHHKRILPREAFLFTRVLDADLGALDLIGYQLPSSTFARGEFIPLVLYFQAREKSAADANVTVQLRDQGDNIVASAQAFAAYPSLQWDHDEIVRDAENLVIPGDALPGEYKIVVSDGAHTVEVARVQVH